MSKIKIIIFTVLIIVGCVFIYLYINRYSLTNVLFIKPLSRFETNEKIVALTFDDGPNPNGTPLLLDLLKKYSVKATFFIVTKNIVAGKHVARNREIIQRALKEGHGIGNHTSSHDLMIFHSYSFMKNNIKKADEVLSDMGVVNPVLFRPPSGEKMILLPLVLKNMNKVLVMWDVHPPREQFIQPFMNRDAELLLKYTADISQYAIDNTRPGSIILLHDGWNCNPDPLLRAVERIIIGLKDKGYRFVTIQEGIDLTEWRSSSS